MGQFEQYQRNKKMDDSIVQNGQRYTQEEFYQYGNMEEGFLQEHIDGYAYKEQRERGLGDNPEAPELADVGGGRKVRCWRVQEGGAA